ncbi:MAG: phosphate/phosphite/phosphonate ABC transporter substrate-binding protein [Desulfuromusa sp.]|nr:phosphate/phosphite/phosphonate ABC transporter substrate-binding protein [Desulfuromusa sp.]
MEKVQNYLSRSFFLRSLILMLLLCCFSSPSYGQEPLVLGIHPFRSIKTLEKKFTPLTDYLSKKLGKEIVLRVGTSYQEHNDAIGQDQIDIAYMGPIPYLQMVRQYGHKPLIACQETNGSPTFKGIIVVREDSSALSLADIEGTVSFVNPHSTMGYIIPAYLLLQEKPEILKERRYQFLKTHENVALGVLIGDFEVGAVKEGVYRAYKERGLKQLAATPAVTEHLFVANHKMSQRLIGLLRQAFYELKESPEGREIMQAIKPSITGFVPISHSDYDSLCPIIDELTTEGILE